MSVDTTLPWSRLFARPYGAYLATFSLGSALYAFAAFLVSACMPSAVQELGHLTLMSWSLTFYLIAAIVAGIVAPPLKWRIGTGAALQCAGLAYLLGSVACGFAPNIWTLLGGRVLQGLGEGTVSSVTYILIPEVFPAAMIPAIFGIEATIWAVGSLAAPVIGGYLTQAISWRAAFLVEIPPILLFMALVWRVIPEGGRRDEAHHPIPVLRVAGVGFGILLLSLAAIEPGVYPRVASLIAAMLVLLLVARSDLAAPNRLLPRGAFSFRKPAGLALWVVLLLPTAHIGPATYIILLIERVWGYDPLTASVLGSVVAAFWGGVGVLVSRLPARWTGTGIWLGPCLLAVGLALGWVGMAAGQILWIVLVGQALIGTGYGLCWGVLSQVIMTGSEEADRDRASAMLPSVLSAGLAIGSALGGIAANAAGLAEGVPRQVVVQAGIACFTVASVVGVIAAVASLRLRATGRV
ncbi:MFS transporter [Acidisoma cellulosilytica]|uniref:MFS transporter n=1 Tax=Acidisoma cellulosilyticum TaxID=2802395 RepID=A0A963YYY7_9PROT|nr:MFS transporter [Acidisoma cellulosilyticum]MCB8879664.1 MFS transporter [Acidisoma cellulosilyticum]